MFTRLSTLIAFALTIPLLVATAYGDEPKVLESPKPGDSVSSAPPSRAPEAVFVTSAAAVGVADPGAARVAYPSQDVDTEIPRGQQLPPERSLAQLGLTRYGRRPNKAARDGAVTSLVAGGITGSIGVLLLAGTLGTLTQNTRCSLDSGGGVSTSGCGNAIFGWTSLGFGASHLLIGSIMLIVGGVAYGQSTN